MKLWISIAAAAVLAMALSPDGAWARGGSQQQIDPVKLALARQIFELSGGEQTVKAQVHRIFEMLKPDAEKPDPGSDEAITNEIFDELEKDMDGIAPRPIEVNVKIYAEDFTEKELRDLLAFFQTESGQAFIKKSPAVRAQASNESMPLILNLLPQVAQKTVDRLCEAKHCDAKERALVNNALARELNR